MNMPKKATPITDIKGPDQVKPSATARPIVVSGRPMIANDPMMVNTADTPADEQPDEPKSAPIVSRTAKTLLPAHDLAEPATEDAVPAADEAEDSSAKQPDEPVPGFDAALPADDTAAEPDAPAEPATASEPAAPQETAPAEASPELEAPAVAEPQPKSPAKSDAEAAKVEAEARQREAEMQSLIDSRQFFVPINTVEQRRTVHVSIWMTLLVIVLSIILIDFMLDANFIVLLTKLPHTHFFAPQPHF